MIHHYMTRYSEKGNETYTSWLQIGSIAFSERYYVDGKRVKKNSWM
ncbi:hypothetical protein DFP99_0586 [Weissella soli]|uniref:Uncharacterized protein n=1 Tax=Weissella soli TaxID=155866 RepID=A0A288QU26_9LACO|nr:hypothetical protein WSWS_00957 [Weissella soli]RDL12153.1 hypothetical protein DFP99_0586 [Weissella soli]GEN92610.1 hypothetical protein WSO01_02220 [Weissella soli]